MDVSTSRDLWEEECRESQSKGVAHGVHKYVWDKEGEGIVGKDQRTQGLAEQSEARPSTGEDPVARGEVEEVDGWRMQLDVEAISDPFEDGSLVDVVVARVDDADSLRPALLCGSDGCPENSLAATASVARCRSDICIRRGITDGTRTGGRSPQYPPTACLPCFLPCHLLLQRQPPPNRRPRFLHARLRNSWTQLRPWPAAARV